jgi:PAS domain S-box-containing protein
MAVREENIRPGIAPGSVDDDAWEGEPTRTRAQAQAPVPRAPSRPAADAQESGADSGRRLPSVLRVLVVEDSPADFELIRIILGRTGWTVEAERVSDEAAMRVALAMHPWDIVIADYHLPNFSGREALALTLQPGTEIPCIMVSGAIGEDAAVAAMQAGAYDCINKNSLTRLPPAVERCLAAAATGREKRRTERALQHSVHELTTLVEACPLPIIGLDRDAKVTRWNPAAERVFGFKSEDALGRFLPIIGPEQREDFLRAHSLVLEGEGQLEIEARRVRADGETIDVAVAVAAMRDADGQAIGTIALHTDISQRKLAERDLRESQDILRKLSAHTDQAIEAERARIARDIHDQIGGTLTALRTELDGLRKRVVSDLDLSARAARMDRLVDETMKAGISISRALRPSILDYGIFPALEWQAKDFQQRTGVKCQVACNDPEMTLGLEQSTTILRLFQEALTNIAKHARAHSVHAELFANAQSVTFEVRDDGRGLTPEQLAKPASFGLRGMMERARALGGWVDVSGAPGKGTTVMASFPRKRQTKTGS